MNELEYTKLRKIIIDANPDIKKRGVKTLLELQKKYSKIGGLKFNDYKDLYYLILKEFTKITIADVLIAFPVEKEIGYKKIDLNVSNNGETLFIDTKNKSCSWNLKNNSLDWHWRNQKETVNFLFNLLV